MLQALLASVASVKAQQTRMNVIGNNLANVNTTAYKSSQVTFQDMLSEVVQGSSGPAGNVGGKNPIQYGLGVLIGGTNINSAQGSLNATNRPSDLAIQGNGFFAVANGENVSYTRDGGFDIDANGDLVQRATGQRLMGWSADATGKIDTSAPLNGANTLNIPLGRLNAVRATSKIGLTGNLAGNATNSDTWTSQVRVYDSLGAAHDLSIQFSNHTVPPASGAPTGSTASWDYKVYEGPVATGTLLYNSGASGNSPLYFDGSGKLVNTTTAVNVSVPASGGGAALTVSMDFSKIGQLDTASQVVANDQNGFPPGSLESYNIGADGVITGTFSNGLTRSLGQIAVADFSNPNGMVRIGNNLWRATDNSGAAVLGVAQTGGRGTLNAGFLEQSNVDMSTEFADLIITQRGYQANTKIITTVDEMLQDLLNIKR